MNYIVTSDSSYFKKIGIYKYCNLEDMDLADTIAVDCETTSLKYLEGEVFAVQIGSGKGDNYLIDLTDNSELTFEDIIPYLEGKTLIGHNLTFDLTWFYKYGFYPNKVKDTFIASKLLYNGYPGGFRHGFGFVMERELGIVYDKSVQKNIHKIQLSTKSAIRYSFNDVDRLLELHSTLEEKLTNQGYMPTYIEHCNYILGLAYMQRSGVPINKEEWLSKIELDKEALKKAQAEIVEYVYDNLPQYRDPQIDIFSNNKKIIPLMSSPTQMMPIFNDLDIKILDDEGKESLKKDLIKKSIHPFADLWITYSEAKHTVTTFGANIFAKLINGRAYSSYNPILDTARISVRRGDINTLNLPSNKRTRQCIKARSGYKMVGADYDSQEVRANADITMDLALIESIQNNSCLHCTFARVLFPEIAGLSDDEIKEKHADKRQAAKAPRFLFSYGGGAYTLALRSDLTIERATEIENAFKELHSGIYSKGKETLAEAVKVGYIESTRGFKLHLPQFELYAKYGSKIEEIDWDVYRIGKAIGIAKLKYEKDEENTDPFEIEDKYAYKYYMNNKVHVSNFYKLQSRYFRLALNNPSQTISAHMTKAATATLFKYIKERGHIDIVLICLTVHDEILLEVREDLAEEYRTKLEEIMITEGNKYLINNIITMDATAKIGDNWANVH